MVLVLNKVDLVKEKARLLPLIESYKAIYDFVEFVPVSAAKGDGLDDLRRVILDRLPEGPAYFPEDYVTDQPERFLAAELVREQVLLATRKEVPHSVAVTVDRWEATPTITRIYATIRVEREGQKPIVIGAGAMLKKNRHAGAGGDGKAVRREDLSGPACARPAGMARATGLPRALDWRTMAGEDE